MTIPELTIEKVVYQGYGLGFYNSKPVFVLNALPGDDLEIEVTSERKGAFFGRINKIIRSSPLRIETACPVFGICGGCDWLNVSYQDQLTLKNGI
ncbi:MAG: hypothetical protein JW996_00715, partial [Candidatus Cloacimonetes bacterium]|nr:hypothetical protein [Candidatus Cloacimonadota bacterium]